MNIKDLPNGIKHSEEKISYQEIDFDFIDLMAKNMSKNKDKYPPFNWQKKVPKEELIDAILRHTRKVKQPVDGDIEDVEQHLVSIACKEQLECKLDVSKRIESIEERIKRQEEILDLLIKIFKI